jgi:hypothetical protein
MSCVAEMLRILYIVTKFDEKDIVVETVVQEEVKQEEPIVKEEPKPQPKKRGRKPKK